MRSAAIGVLLDQTHTQILLVKRRDVPVWVLPGGGIEEGETPEHAVCREFQEETGFQVEIIRKIAEYYPINKLAAETHLYECRFLSGSPTLGTETSAISFFPLKALPEDFFIVHRDWLHDALLQQPTLLKKPITRVTYANLILYFLKRPFQVLRFALTRLFE